MWKAGVRCDYEFPKDPVVSLQHRQKPAPGRRWVALPQYFFKSFWHAYRRSQSKSLKKLCSTPECGECGAEHRQGAIESNTSINSTVGRASFGQDGFILVAVGCFVGRHRFRRGQSVRRRRITCGVIKSWWADVDPDIIDRYHRESLKINK